MTPETIKESRWYDALVYGVWFTLGVGIAEWGLRKLASRSDDDEDDEEDEE